MTSIIC